MKLFLFVLGLVICVFLGSCATGETGLFDDEETSEGDGGAGDGGAGGGTTTGSGDGGAGDGGASVSSSSVASSNSSSAVSSTAQSSSAVVSSAASGGGCDPMLPPPCDPMFCMIGCTIICMSPGGSCVNNACVCQ